MPALEPSIIEPIWMPSMGRSTAEGIDEAVG